MDTTVKTTVFPKEACFRKSFFSAGGWRIKCFVE